MQHTHTHISQLADSSKSVSSSSSSRKSQSVRLEHNTVEPVAASCTYASAINASKISSVFIVYRCKTLTGSLDPMRANGTDKPCRFTTSKALSLGLCRTCGRTCGRTGILLIRRILGFLASAVVCLVVDGAVFLALASSGFLSLRPTGWRYCKQGSSPKASRVWMVSPTPSIMAWRH